MNSKTRRVAILGGNRLPFAQDAKRGVPHLDGLIRTSGPNPAKTGRKK